MKKQDIDINHEIFSKNNLFGTLNTEDVDKILAFAVKRNYSDGQAIFKKGDAGNSMMIVLQGEVVILATSIKGRELVLNTIKRGQIFGEMALLDGKERSADAIAAGNCEVLAILRNDFLHFLHKNTDIAIQLLIGLCQKLRQTSITLEDIGLFDIKPRLARLLLKMADSETRSNGAYVRVKLRMSQSQIGRLVGASRESVNIQLRDWLKMGILRKELDGYSILRLEDFKNIADMI